ncbi:RND family efflux transporter MFP subunit, partial [mine drainage metagenome]
GVSAAQLNRIVAEHRAQEYLTFPSPVSGYLAQVSVRQKSFIQSGQAVMRIEQLSSVWLDAKVYENQLPWVRLGQVMQARLAADPGRTLEGTIFFIDPTEDPRTHTVTVRAQLANPEGQLRPGMYALVDILTTPLKNVLLAPASAVIHTGTGEVALVAEGEGRFVPHPVTTGLTGSDGMVQILSGLTAGEQVVTSGQFL